MAGPFVSFLSDFGARDASAAICRGVVLDIAPDARILDITHEVRKFAVRDAAFLLRNALPHLPQGVHFAVVDPGVGTARRPIAVLTGRGDPLVGPDNGLLLPAAEALGGLVAARALENRYLWLPSPTTSTFHGRDIFAPVAAHLAAGVPFETVGPELDPAGLEALPWPATVVEADRVRTAVVYVDSFGNVKLGATTKELRDGLGEMRPGDRLMVTMERPGGPARFASIEWVVTFGDVSIGQPAIYDDSFRRVSIAVNQGSAATVLDLALDDGVTLAVDRRPR